MRIPLFFFVSVFLTVAGCNKSTEPGRIPEADPDQESSGEASILTLSQAIEDDPENPKYYFKRSRVYFRTGNLQLALSDINSAIGYDKTDPEFYLQQGRIYYGIHQLAAALKACIHAEELKSTDPELYILISQIYMDLRNERKSEEYMNKASAIAPHHTDLFVLKAKILAARGDTTAAVSNLFSALRKDPHNAGSYKELVKIYESARKTDSAMVFLTAGRSISPRDPFYFYYDGRFFEGLNFKQAAKKSYETALQTDSTYYPAYYSLALMAYRQEDYASALKNFVNVVRFDPTQKEANLYAAELYEKNNQGYEAISYYERVRAADTSNVKAKSALEKLYIQYPDRKKVQAKDSTLTVKADTSQTIKKDSAAIPQTPVQPGTVKPAANRPLNPPIRKQDTTSKGNTTTTVPVEVKKDTVK